MDWSTVAFAGCVVLAMGLAFAAVAYGRGTRRREFALLEELRGAEIAARDAQIAELELERDLGAGANDLAVAGAQDRADAAGLAGADPDRAWRLLSGASDGDGAADAPGGEAAGSDG